MTSIVLSIALAPPTHALSAPEVPAGIEPQRVHFVHGSEQGRHLASEPWQDFVHGEGEGWLAVFDEVTGTPRRMWGRGIDLGPLLSSSEAGEAVVVFLNRHARLLGFEQNTLRLRSARYSEAASTWYVDVDVPLGGLTVYRGGLTARIKHGRLISIGADTYPGVPVTGSLRLDARAARHAAVAQGPVPRAEHTDVSAEPMLLVREGLDALQLRTTWMVRTRTASPPGAWVSFVDGEDGTLLDVHNEVRFVAGQVLGEHNARTEDGAAPVVSPMPLTWVSADGLYVVADEQGAYEVDPGALYRTHLQGLYIIMDNVNGPQGELVSPDPVMTWTDEAGTRAEINSYVFMHQVRDWGRQVAPEVAMNDIPIRVHVNDRSGTCNAYWNGDITFYDTADGCNNTALIADVNYHEWGHGFHSYSLEAGNFDGSLSEGAADVIANFLTGDSVIAPWFGIDGWALRNTSNSQRYPDDYNPYGSVHQNGLIFGGAMWDLWQILQEDLGAEEGTAVAAQIFKDLLKSGTNIPNSYDEAMVADDDDGDLLNGTPHDCAIIEAFGNHGLGPVGSGVLFTSFHAPLVDQKAGADHPVAVDLIAMAPTCFPGDPVGAEVFYRTDGRGKWEFAALNVNGMSMEGAIPAQEQGSFVEYYISIDDSDGTTFLVPSGGEINPSSFYVGDVLPVWCDDFEDNDGGFTHELREGEESEGADDWQWGRPNGRGGDPAAALSGERVWGNDLGWDDYNGAYQSDKHNQLKSEVIDLAHYTGTFLSYWRWLNVQDGCCDQATITANKKKIWSNVATEGGGVDDHLDELWVPHVVPFGDTVEGYDVQLAFNLISDSGDNFGGWTIDDLCVLAPATPDNRLGVGDFFAARTDTGDVALSWTNPIHEPLESVRVVRKFSGLPEGATDGVVVYESHSPEVGGRVLAVDDMVFGQAAYYAVYPGDGTDRLSWTLEDFNAAFVAGSTGGGGQAGGTDGGDGGGCGCAGVPGPAGLRFALPLLALVLLRRRSQ